MTTTRRFSRAALAAMLAGGTMALTAVAAAPLGGPADAPTTMAERVDPPAPAVLIGDSAISALRWVPGADNAIVGFEHTLDLESCRRLLQASCRGREGRIPPTVVQALDFHADKYSTLIVATGYNDGAGIFAESFDAVIASARFYGYDRIVWWTLRSDVDYVSPGSIGNHETFALNNQVVRSKLATGNYPEVVLADWGGYTAEKAEWFVTDGVHYRQVGAWAASDYLTRKMAFIEGRPCPIPTAPGVPVDDPCPDPDQTGPVAEIESLYTIGEDGVLCYEVGVERTIECRFDTHVIQLTRVLRIGDQGDDVRALQTRLNRLGLLDAGATGNFGPLTEAAVRAFQASEQLPSTGVADVATLIALGFDVSGIDGASPTTTTTTTTTTVPGDGP